MKINAFRYLMNHFVLAASGIPPEELGARMVGLRQQWLQPNKY
jgi:hypothetical protein